MGSPEDILTYWLDEIGPDGWYRGGEALDAEIRDKFQSEWDDTMAGANALWLTYASGTLAYIVLTDQLSRNMFRGTGKAFASDKIAKAAAKAAISRGWDMRIDGMARQFFYMPLMHSECLSDQERCVRLMKERMPDGGAENLDHARAHREIIRRYGRFPTRNADLGRTSRANEQAYLDSGGYGAILEELRQLEAA